jgi:hypothetical protein
MAGKRQKLWLWGTFALLLAVLSGGGAAAAWCLQRPAACLRNLDRISTAEYDYALFTGSFTADLSKLPPSPGGALPACCPLSGAPYRLQAACKRQSLSNESTLQLSCPSCTALPAWWRRERRFDRKLQILGCS